MDIGSRDAGDIANSSDKADYPHTDLTGKILTAAFNVHSILGPGFLEKLYENALMHELRKMNLVARQQVRYPVLYEGYPIGEHVLDIVVEDKVYVELKCQKLTGLEMAQVLSGLKASHLPLGLPINFNVEHLRNGIKRVILPRRYLD